MDGYWNRPDDTLTAMEGGWFHTGDLATMDSDHYVLIVDRKKDIIVSGGENISSLEVEKVLVAHAGGLRSRRDSGPEREVGRSAQGTGRAETGRGGQRTGTGGVLPLPTRALQVSPVRGFLESFPKTGTGKILKRELRKLYAAGVASVQTPSDCRAAL